MQKKYEKYNSKFDDIKNSIRHFEGFIEVFVLAFVYYLIWRYCYSDAGFYPYLGRGKYILAGIYGVLMYVIFHYCEGFQYGYLKLMAVIVSQWIGTGIVNFVTYFQLCLLANHMIYVVPMLILTVFDFIIEFVFTYFFTLLYHKAFVPRRMIMINGGPKGIALKSKMETRGDKYQITEILDVSVGLDTIIKKMEDFDAVVINDVPAQIRNDILKYCYENSIRTYVTPKLSDLLVRGADTITLFDTPLLLVKGRGLNLSQRVVKRCIDIVLSSIGLIPALPIMLITAIAIKLEDGGPVFYKQERVTKDGKTFMIMKFRSMIVNAEEEGKSKPAIDGDPRITKVGQFIRATRIDEIPQILNILKGDMSIVGPRPERTEHMERFCEEMPEFKFRTKVKGGLTGFAQIYGKYNTSAYDKLRLDLMYIENYSLMLDIRLIIMTVRVLFSKEATEGFDKEEAVFVLGTEEEIKEAKEGTFDYGLDEKDD